MPEATFIAAKNKCVLRATTYRYRHGIIIDEPLIDFSKERDPTKASDCFDGALEQVGREATERSATHTSYIWESRD